MNESNFKFKLGQIVEIKLSQVIGTVVARTEWLDNRSPNSYCLHYIDGTKNAVYNWYLELDLRSL
jgi:hypothetical protein